MMRKLVRLALRCAVLLVTIAATIVLVRAFDARALPDLQPWHTTHFDSEFRAGDLGEDASFEDYRKLEAAVFDELDRKIYQRVPAAEQAAFNRFQQGSYSHPDSARQNWNRSFELVPSRPVGGILMLHGLTDSPYSMRALADLFYERGFYVLALRLPGHGLAPSALLQVAIEDWIAATRLGVRHVRSSIGAGAPLYLGGYSNGGALAVQYTLDALRNDELEIPDRVLLLSPALGVTRFAVLADWHKALSWLPYFRKFAWESVQPEYDPFKYNSFPKIAGYRTFGLTRIIEEQIAGLQETGGLERMPPVLSFQSLVDSTVSTPELIEGLYDHLVMGNSELVLYDVNRFGPVYEFIQASHEETLTRLMSGASLPYTVSIVANRDGQSGAVVVRSRAAGSDTITETDLAVRWPAQVYSLSHVAIPFSPDDEYYGSGERVADGLGLGTLAPRGERDVLSVPPKQFLRIRFNPFFDDLERRVIEFCAACDPVAP